MTMTMICKKANPGIGAMRRIKPFARDTLEKVYKSLVLPYFEYIVPLFGTTAKNY